MTPVGELLADEIRRGGPVPFRHFMELALYHPELGYYRKSRDPFGKEGDFYTAEQIQPVFGILMAQRVRQLYSAMGMPADFTVLELGAGRGEMAPAFQEWHYLPVELSAAGRTAPSPLANAGASQKMPEHFQGVVFSNEFFDALPVDVAIWRDGAFREQRVGFSNGRFVWHTANEARVEVADYLTRYYPPPEEGRWYEANLEALQWTGRIGELLTKGYAVTVDYGYTRAEAVRFPAGTLMGYRRHTAHEDVLTDPGERDITAHVNFTALKEHGEQFGLRCETFDNLAHTILAAGEPDQFAAALHAESESDTARRRMQLKTLLFGMGETFRVLIQRKE